MDLTLSAQNSEVICEEKSMNQVLCAKVQQNAAPFYFKIFFFFQ